MISLSQIQTCQLAKEEDDFTRQQWLYLPRWIARLSNGETIIQDDYRPGVEPHSAWLRLMGYAHTQKINVVELYIQFRSHIEKPLPVNAAGYYFSKSMIGYPGAKTGMHFYLIGYLQDGLVHIQSWKVPELTQIEAFTREPTAGPNLIVNQMG